MARYIMEEMPDIQKTGKRITYPEFARIDNASIKELAQRVGDVSGFSAGDIEGESPPNRHRNGASDGGRTLCENRRNRNSSPLTRPMQGQRTRRGGRRRQTPKRTKHLRRRSEFSGRQNDDQKH